MKYNVTKRDGKSGTIEAERYEQDGSGVRFYNGKEIVASFTDGVISEVTSSEAVNFDD